MREMLKLVTETDWCMIRSVSSRSDEKTDISQIFQQSRRRCRKKSTSDVLHYLI